MQLWMLEKDTLKWKLWQEYRAQKGYQSSLDRSIGLTRHDDNANWS